MSLSGNRRFRVPSTSARWIKLADHHRVNVQPGNDDGRPGRCGLDFQVFALRFQMGAGKAVIRGECDPAIENRHDFLAKRYVIIGQRVEGRRVEVAVEVNDQPIRAVLGLPHHGRMDAHRRLDLDRLRAGGHPVDRVAQQQTLIWIGIQVIGRVESSCQVDDATAAVRAGDYSGNFRVAFADLDAERADDLGRRANRPRPARAGPLKVTLFSPT